MSFKIVFNALGNLLIFIGITMLAPLIVAIHYQEPLHSFIISIILTWIVGITLSIKYKSDEEWKRKDGFAIVAIGWLVAAIFGAIPFLFEGISPMNALFESMSGFTTTGATALSDIEAHTKSLLFWRSMTQWIGGMGIIMLFIAILPKLGVAGRQLFRAEAPGPTEDKIKPRIRDTAKTLWKVYVSFSVLLFALLYLAGMNFYDALVHTFTTMSCGGFSPHATSIVAFNSPLIEWILIIFMFIAGANFALYYRMLYVNPNSLIKDDEYKFYISLIFIATILLTGILVIDMNIPFFDSVRYSAFQIISIVTTTGFASTDFNLWSYPSKMILLAVMFIGGCAGSTAGGIKVVRIHLLLKYARRDVFKLLHPRAIRPIKFNEKIVPDEIMQAIISFILIYLLIFSLSSVLLSMMGLDLISAITASIVTIGNIGPGFGIVGPMENFSVVPLFGRLLLILNMWIGRLEVFTVIILFMPEFWKK
ncbi:MAG: TrkH family potassium uptake protein [Methanosarcinales archaeon]|jgi:trk system potassium uptake protein TrkH|nr:TrkH family potassium uptake protein [Methanosarcinales archaeon]